MLELILKEWSEYAKNMGSTVYEFKEGFASKIVDSPISCDFANSIILNRPLRKDDFSDFTNLFGNKLFAVYVMSPKTLDRLSLFNLAKVGSIMVIKKSKWSHFGSGYSSEFVRKSNSLELYMLDHDELSSFADVVFEAFGYDNELKEQSIKLYRNGIASKKVAFYGLKLTGKLVSCALFHWHQGYSMGGVELVSTCKNFQRKGLSKILMTKLIDDNFNKGISAIWLFALKNSIAEKFYKELGFSKIGNIYVYRINDK